MTDTSIQVACCQLAPVLGEPAANRELCADAVDRAAADGACVIVLPELVSSGYVFHDRAQAASVAEPADGPTVAGWVKQAQNRDVVIVGGFAERAPSGEVFNSCALVDSTGPRAIYRKAHLWDAERTLFAAGRSAPPVVATRFGAIGLMVCYDLEFPEWVRMVALAGAELLCAPVNWPAAPRPAGERPSEQVRVQAGAAVNRMFIAACDRTGRERGVDWVGGSIIVDVDGWPVSAASPGGSVDIITAHCDLALARDKRIATLSDVFADRRPELYGPLVTAPADQKEPRTLTTTITTRSRVEPGWKPDESVG